MMNSVCVILINILLNQSASFIVCLNLKSNYQAEVIDEIKSFAGLLFHSFIQMNEEKATLSNCGKSIKL